jgi:hypothetical protein
LSSDPNAEIDDETGDKIIGFVVSVALMLGQWPALSYADAQGARRMAAVTNAFEDGRFFWVVRDDWSAPAVFALLLPLALIPGAFGFQWRQLVPKLPPVWRWRLVLGVMVVIALAHGMSIWQASRDLGVATASEAVWLHDGEEERRLTWAGATGIDAACTMIQPRRGEPYPRVDYDVFFDDGRSAPLAQTADADLSAWLVAVAPIDAALRDARIPRSAAADPECLKAYADRLGDEDVARLGAMMAH